MPTRMIQRYISRIFKRDLTLLGRWKLDNFKQTKLKIDMANMDHCGTCLFKDNRVKELPKLLQAAAAAAAVPDPIK